MRIMRALAIILTTTVVVLALPLSSKGLQVAQANLDADAEQIIGALIGMRSTGMINWEKHHQLVGEIEAAPERFAPILRERLSQIPATLDEYDPDDRDCVLNGRLDPRSGSQAGSLLGIVGMLPLDDAEPILQEFFDKVNPLALEAQRRFWAAKDAAIETGRQSSDEWVRSSAISDGVARGRSAAIAVARSLHSPILIDDVLTMLESDDDAARFTGAVLADRYVLEFAAERPDAMVRVVAAAADLNAAENPRLAPVARALTKRIREVVQPEPRNDTPTDPEQQRDP